MATFGDIKTRILNRLDISSASSTTWLNTTELNSLANLGLARLHGLIAQHACFDDYLTMRVQATLPSLKQEYTLTELGIDGYGRPRLHKLRKIFIVDPSGNRTELRSFGLSELQTAAYLDYTVLAYGFDTTATVMRYRLYGNNRVMFSKIPATQFNLEIWYIPEAPTYTNDSQPVEYSFLNGWEEYAVNEAVIKAKLKEEADVGPFLDERAEFREYVKAQAETRDLANPQRTVDVESTSGFWYVTR